MKLHISSSNVIKFLSIFALTLIIIHLAILGIYFYINNPKEFDFIRMFDLDMERNIPTLFSSILLLISAFLFYLLSKTAIDKKHRYWFGLSMVFVFLAFDESAKIHEKLGDFTEKFIDASGYFYYPWFIGYGILVLLLGIVYIRFFWNMERNVFLSFMLAAILFLTGAIGFDILGAKEASMHGEDTILYCFYYTIEESLEMFGVIYLISILFKLLENTSIEIES